MNHINLERRGSFLTAPALDINITAMEINGMSESNIGCNEIAPANPEDYYPTWSNDLFMNWLLYDRKTPAWLVAILVFFFYWVIPFIYSFSAKTILRKDTKCPDVPYSICKTVVEVQQLGIPNCASITYLQDDTHFIFAVTIAVGGGLASYVIRRFNLTVIELRKSKIPLGEEDDFVALYHYYKNIMNHWGFKVFSLSSAIAVFAVFFKLSSLETHRDWWGYIDYGCTGYILALIEGIMVYEGSKVITSLGFGSFMLSRFIRRHPLKLRPFHPDGCNGLTPFGHQVLFLWLVALALIFSIYVTLKFGYLDVEKTVVVWIIAVFGTLVIPALAIFPLIASLLSIQNARLDRMSGLENILESLLDQTLEYVKQGRSTEALATEEKMNKIKSMREVIHSANIWPFNSKMLVGVFLVNVIQVILTANEIIELFH